VNDGPSANGIGFEGNDDGSALDGDGSALDGDGSGVNDDGSSANGVGFGVNDGIGGVNDGGSAPNCGRGCSALGVRGWDRRRIGSGGRESDSGSGWSSAAGEGASVTG
jgi:hypothetical protein